jgi:acetyltransferase-like isoleucine patch superfamily enzyme
MERKRLFKFLSRVTLKSIYFNFKYLPFNTALKLPILVSNHTYLKLCAGSIVINGPIRTGMIQIGFATVGIFDHKRSRSIWNVSGRVIFKGKTFIGQGSKLSVGGGGTLTLGSDFNISSETAIICSKAITFGNNCLLSWEILLMDDDYHQITNMENEVINEPTPIIVGNDVWIGCRCTILKGSVIPNNSIIAATTTVAKKLVQQDSIYGGNPLKVLKTGIKWKLE